MADRDRYDWDRERGRDEWDREGGYGRGAERGRGYDDRGMMARGADEVRSWFGDDEARRRREADEQRERSRDWSRDRERGFGPNSESTRREHGWGPTPEPRWDDSRARSPRMAESTREWYDRGPNAGSVWGSSHTYGLGAPDWSGAPSRDAAGPRRSSSYDDQRDSRAYERSSFGGGYAAGTSSPSFGGGYGAGNYQSGNYRTGEASREPAYGRGMTGEGRWGGPGTDWAGNFAGRGPRNYQRADDRICEDVNERLTADPRVDAYDIEVRVQNGEVTLSGRVDDRRTRRLAEEIIEDLPGVRDVRNDLRVRNQGWSQDDSHREGPQATDPARSRNEGGIGSTGDPQKRDDTTTLNQTGRLNR